MSCSILYFAYLGFSRIYEDSLTFRLELTNEVLFLLTCYHFILYTNFLTNPDDLEGIGISMIIFILIILIVNTFVTISSSIRACKQNLAKRYIKNVEISEDKHHKQSIEDHVDESSEELAGKHGLFNGLESDQ